MPRFSKALRALLLAAVLPLCMSAFAQVPAPPDVAARSYLLLDVTANQVLAQMDLWANKDKYEKTVYRLPKKLDEEVARLHLEKIGVVLTKLTKAQAEYLGVPSEGPYKPEHYRY